MSWNSVRASVPALRSDTNIYSRAQRTLTQSQPPSHVQLLLLDVALQLIHADRESLKRVETFIRYPGHYGFRVRDAIEEIFILLLKVLVEKHIEKAFSQ